MKEEEYQQLLKDFDLMAITYHDTQRLTAEIDRRIKIRGWWLECLSRIIPHK
jgi:sporulation-control protein spo0M